MQTTTNPPMFQRRRDPNERRLDQGFQWLTLLMACTVGLLLLGILWVVCSQSRAAIGLYGLRFLFTSAWPPVEGNPNVGIWPMLSGTLVSSLLALAFAIPIGVGSAIFLTENLLPKSVRNTLSLLIELLAAIPSVVYGLWGFAFLVPLLLGPQQWLYDHFNWMPIFSEPPQGMGMVPAVLVLVIMVLPIITAISKDALQQVPDELRQAAYGLGGTRWSVIFQVLLPAALSGIVSGIMLALGRAMGETMAVTLICGNSQQYTPSILAPANTIASLIANEFAEADGLQIEALMYAALVLMLSTLLVNILAQLIVSRLRLRY